MRGLTFGWIGWKSRTSNQVKTLTEVGVKKELELTLAESVDWF